MTYKNTWTYHGIVELNNFGVYLFNHGTESKKKSRTANHINDCKAYKLVYEVIEEKQDRLKGTNVIAPIWDKEFVNKVADRLNTTILKNSTQKAASLKDWFKSLPVLLPIDRGYYDALRLANLSETECCVIPESVSRDQLAEVVKWVEDTWYYEEKKLLVSAKPYSSLTKSERKMAAKPFPARLFNKVFELIRHGKKFVERLNYKTAYVQSVLLAWTLSLQDDFRNLQKITVIVTGNDKNKYKDLYEAMLHDNRFILKDCESDNDVIEEYFDMDINTDLIISNPPYGPVGANATKRLIEVVNFKSFVNLLPANDYKRNADKDLFNYQSNMVAYKKAFGKEAAVTTHLATIHKQKVNNLTEDQFLRKQYLIRSLDKYFDFVAAHPIKGYNSGTKPENWTPQNTFVIGQRVIASGQLPIGTDNDAYKWNIEKSLTIDELIKEHNANWYIQRNKVRIDLCGITRSESEIEQLNKLVYNNKDFWALIFNSVNTDAGVFPLEKIFPELDYNNINSTDDLLKACGYTQPEIDEVYADVVKNKGE